MGGCGGTRKFSWWFLFGSSLSFRMDMKFATTFAAPLVRPFATTLATLLARPFATTFAAPLETGLGAPLA